MDQRWLPIGYPQTVPAAEPRGRVYTKPWVVEFLLDLAGYGVEENLVDALAIEPAAGMGAFLIPMALRLVDSCRRRDRPLSDCAGSLIAHELDEAIALAARRKVVDALVGVGIEEAMATRLAAGWVHVGDYLLEAAGLPRADFVIGNPPYIRLEEIPPETASLYRDAYPTMRGRADLYVAFFEAALRRLKPSGVCAYICADRWMLNQYGAELRRLVTRDFGVEMVVEMHDADPFDDEVSAYPAITVIRRGPQPRVIVASIGPEIEVKHGGALATSLREVAVGETTRTPPGLTAATMDTWFTGPDPWPLGSPPRLALLRRLEERFEPLESRATGTQVGIGVATGLDRIFITRDATLVEPSRLLPLAMARDTASGHFRWSGHYLVNPWDDRGLVDLEKYPRLRAYLNRHQETIRKRNTARRNPRGWYRTIDRVNPSLTERRKLYVPDIKDVFNPVLDDGETHPHHNLYYIASERWDLEVLGGLLLPTIAQLFIEAYGVRMRGGYLRFQAQYLRRVRVPDPESITTSQAERLIQAFRARDRQRATATALEIHGIGASEIDLAH